MAPQRQPPERVMGVGGGGDDILLILFLIEVVWF